MLKANKWNTKAICEMYLKLDCKHCQACNFIKKRIQRRCFLLNFTKFSRTLIYRTPLVDCFCISSCFLSSTLTWTILVIFSTIQVKTYLNTIEINEWMSSLNAFWWWVHLQSIFYREPCCYWQDENEFTWVDEITVFNLVLVFRVGGKSHCLNFSLA